VSGSVDKVLRVGGVDYVIDEGDGADIARIVDQVEQALRDGGVVKVPVLDAERRRMTLYLNGGRIDVVVIDLAEGPRPGEISPK
jgi:hypothetical protein